MPQICGVSQARPGTPQGRPRKLAVTDLKATFNGGLNNMHNCAGTITSCPCCPKFLNAPCYVFRGHRPSIKVPHELGSAKPRPDDLSDPIG
jgi:hypothetical protein